MEENTTKVEGLQVKVKQIPRNTPGFLPLWKKLLAMKRGLMDFTKAQPEDIDAAIEVLTEYMVEPESQAEKMRVITSITADQVMEIINAITGGGEVPPKNGGA